MTLIDKLNFIQKSLGFSDKKFAVYFDIKLYDFLRWKSGEVIPSQDDLKSIISEFNLDVEDFMNTNSYLGNQKLSNEHPCKVKNRKDIGNTIYEDFAREDNSRYEEKD